MPELEAKQHPDSPDWQAEILRLTAFLSPSAQNVEQGLWKAITNEVPNRRIDEPRTGLQQEEGEFRDGSVEGNLILTIQPTRIDWQLVPLPAIPDSGFAAIGPLSDSLDSFLALMLRWIEIAPPVQRLAFGATLNKSVNSSQEGYEWLSSYLHRLDLDDDASDLLYQINRPRKSASTELSGLSINRLSRWGVNLLTSFDLDPKNPGQYITRPAKFSVRLELDINTAPDPSVELTSKQLPQVFQELVELGKEIAAKGDIK